MPSYVAGIFAIAGVAAAAGPVIIHLLNRRRYRVVQWAAMDFLREAVQRNRRILQLRDLVLLALRTLCVLLFGLAMARPYFASGQGAIDSNQPVHAVFIVDNSLSMGYERLDGTLLDEAKAKALEFAERLPQGSRMSVLPLCGSTASFSRDAFRTIEDFRDALLRIEVVDRAASAAQAADLALDACSQVTDLASKRVVFVGDQQAVNWPAGSLAAQFKQLPEMQIVQISADQPENAWVAEFLLQDGIADVETETVFLANVRYEGQAPRTNVSVTLAIDTVEVASQTVDLEPGQTREVRFTHRFDRPIEPGQVEFVAASVSLAPDRLKADDQRFLAVPVVAALPVVFVDQYGPNEDPSKNRYGETFHLRRLLAPVASRGDVNRQLVQVRHLTIDRLDRQTLQDARLVVIAGVERPEVDVSVLREYVQQGGQLVIAAGANFDPAAWSSQAWQEGHGVLPAPLKPQPVGRLPDEATGRLDPFFLAPETMVHDYFYVDQSSREELEDLYRTPLFFKAAVADVSEQALDALEGADVKRITEDRQFLTEADVRQAQWNEKQARGTLTEEEQRLLAADEQRRNEIQPAWLLWKTGRTDRDREIPPRELARSWRPRVLASFTSKIPFLVERQLGRGQILFVSSGVHSPWNNLTNTNAVLIFDQILRTKLARTLPARNFATTGQIVLPIEPADRRAEIFLTRPAPLQSALPSKNATPLAAGRTAAENGKAPANAEESLAVEALGGERFGITIRDVAQRGAYRVKAYRPGAAGDGGATAASAKTGTTAAVSSGDRSEENKAWDLTLVVNGPEKESELGVIDEKGLRERMGEANYRWVARGQPISLEGAQISGHNLWKWLMACVIVGLLAELAILAWPEAAKEPAT